MEKCEMKKLVALRVFFSVFVIAIGVWIYAGCKSREERAIKEANFCKTAEGRKAKIIEAELEKMPRGTIFVTHAGEIRVLRGIVKSLIVYEISKQGIVSSDASRQDELSRSIKEIYYPGSKEEGYLLRTFLWGEKLPPDWRKNIR